MPLVVISAPAKQPGTGTPTSAAFHARRNSGPLLLIAQSESVFSALAHGSNRCARGERYEHDLGGAALEALAADGAVFHPEVDVGG